MGVALDVMSTYCNFLLSRIDTFSLYSKYANKIAVTLLRIRKLAIEPGIFSLLWLTGLDILYLRQSSKKLYP
jgi:hypothetical protein